MGGRRKRLADRASALLGPRLGLWVTDEPPNTSPVIVDDPRLQAYDASGRGVAVDVSFEAGRLHVFPLGGDVAHPWVEALRSAFRSGDGRELQRTLAAYYGLVAPAGPHEWLGLESGAVPGLRGFPPGAVVEPWGTTRPDESLRALRARQERERRGYGLPPDMVPGSPAFGPMVEPQIEAECEKLRHLASSIRRHGLQADRADYDVGGVFLIRDDQWCWIAGAGRHRLAVARALGITGARVGVRAVVRREEVGLWPRVADGTFSRDGALAVFDRFMEGRVPAVVEPWRAWLAKRDARCAGGMEAE